MSKRALDGTMESVCGDDVAMMEDALKELTGANEDEWLAHLPALVSKHGLEAICAWRDDKNKHKHRLVHTAAVKDYVRALKAMHAQGFDLNAQRDSDKCTPLHLAIFFKKASAAATLKSIGVDTSLANGYGETCDAKYEQLAASMHNIVFMDLELTAGHYDADPARVLELAAIITDKELTELGRGQWTIGGFSKEDLESLKEFHQKTFRDAEVGGLFPPLSGSPGNGLFSSVLSSTTTKEQAQNELMGLLRKHCVEKACPIAGNSIQCDREVLKEEMPGVYAFFNHRIIDVSTFTGVMERWLPGSLEAWKKSQETESNYNHRAMNDVESSIQTMRWVRQHLLVQTPDVS